MALERRRDTTSDDDQLGPVRLNAQDLRDIAAVFSELDSQVTIPIDHPAFRTTYSTPEHQTSDIQDVLDYDAADTLASLLVLSGVMRLSLSIWSGGTTLGRVWRNVEPSDERVIDDAAENFAASSSRVGSAG